MNEIKKLNFKSEPDFSAYVEDKCLDISGFDWGCMESFSIRLDKSDTLRLLEFLKDSLGECHSE